MGLLFSYEKEWVLIRDSVVIVWKRDVGWEELGIRYYVVILLIESV